MLLECHEGLKVNMCSDSLQKTSADKCVEKYYFSAHLFERRKVVVSI